MRKNDTDDNKTRGTEPIANADFDPEAVDNVLEDIKERDVATASEINTPANTGTVQEWRENIPDDLKSIDRWLMWDASPGAPRRPHWRGDFSISWNDPDTWHTFDDAVEAAQKRDEWGIGFVTGKEVSVIDLDGCSYEDENGNKRAKDWVPSFSKFRRAAGGDEIYVEWSPSETGLHIPVKDLEIPEWWTDIQNDENHEGVDVLQGQFCTVTGRTETGFGGDIVEFAPDVSHWLFAVREAWDTDSDEFVNGGSTGWKPDEEWLTGDDIRDALDHIDPDCGYNKWRNIGFAVAEFFFEDGDINDDYDAGEAQENAVELFTQWSKRANDKWDSEAPEQAGRIIKESWERIPVEEEPISIGTLIAYAKQAGWEMPPPPELVRGSEARKTIEEFIEEFDPVDDRPEKSNLADDNVDPEDPDVQEKLAEWPTPAELNEVADAVVDLSKDALDEFDSLIAARLNDIQEKDLRRHRRVSRAMCEQGGTVVNVDGRLVKVETNKRWLTYKALLNFELDATSLLSIEGEDRMANVEVRPSEPTESSFEMQIEPRVFNDSRRFKDEILAKRFSTTIETTMSESDVMDLIRKYISRQDVPDLVGQKQMGLSRTGDEFVTPNGTINADGWTDDPETIYVERDIGAEKKFQANPDEHDTSKIVNDDVARMIELFTGTRNPERFVPVLGWLYAAPFRPEIVDRIGSFNLLHVNGESGIGKTGSLGVGSRLFGMSSEPFSCTDTKFAQITSLASSRSVPIWLDEYKVSDMPDWQQNMLHELLRKAATGGVEQRGNADQTTEEYYLRAPVVISGETSIRGSAEQRRAIATTFTNQPTRTGTEEFHRFKELAGDATTDEDGNVTFPDARFELEEHAVAYYSYVAGTSNEEFEAVWYNAREYVSKLLAEWDIELDDLEVQGLQTVVTGYRFMVSFAHTVSADLDKLPSQDDLDAALRYVADVDGDGRETHTDQFVGLVQRATVAGYLEEDTHFAVVREGKAGEELRVNVTRAFDEVSKYVRDHDLNEDLLGSAKDYKDRFDEAVEQDTYVMCTSQGTTGIGRAVGIHTGRAGEELAEFDRLVFTDFTEEHGDAEIIVDDDDNRPTTLAEIGDNHVGKHLTVTDVSFTGLHELEESKAHSVGTLYAAGEDETEMSVIAFEDPGELDTPCYIELQNAKIGTYQGEVQIQIDRRTSVHVVEQSDEEQGTMTDISDAVNDGGKGETGTDTEEIDQLIIAEASPTTSKAGVAGAVSSKTDVDIDRLAHRIDILAECGDIVVSDPYSEGSHSTGEKTVANSGSHDDSDPAHPDRVMFEHEVQCRSCGVCWPVVSKVEGYEVEGFEECPRCDEDVEWEWNAEHRSFNLEYRDRVGEVILE